MKNHEASRPVFHIVLAFFHRLRINMSTECPGLFPWIRPGCKMQGQCLAVHCTLDTTSTMVIECSQLDYPPIVNSPPAIPPLASARPLRLDAAEDVAKCFSSSRESLRERAAEEPEASKTSPVRCNRNLTYPAKENAKEPVQDSQTPTRGVPRKLCHTLPRRSVPDKYGTASSHDIFG